MAVLMARVLLGLSIGSPLDGIDAVAVRAGGIGLGLAPRIERTLRLPFLTTQLQALRAQSSDRRGGLAAAIAEAAVQAARTVAVQAGLSSRDIFLLGFLEPAHSTVDTPISWSEVAGRIAEGTGLTVVHGFRHRDRAAGGAGHPITALADFFLYHNDREDRLVIHLGAVSSVLLLSGAAKVGGIQGWEAGPGSQLLDAILFHGTRGKESNDPYGKKAVQGRCLEPLLARWLEHPYLSRKPPKAVPADAFGRSFLHAAFDTARVLGAGLSDLLCTASHFIARSIGDAWRILRPAGSTPPRVLLTGGGVRNGFLWQLVGQVFEGTPLARSDDIGIPAAARKAAAAAILAALTCDGVPGNVAPLTGAAGGRVLGHIVPGDTRNWSRCSTWLAEQVSDPAHHFRAA
jgi:anhydro-N-acetylmuramic acid kinase